MWSLSALTTEDRCGEAGREGRGVVKYILERCLHISKSYVSCLGKSMTLYFIYLLISWSHLSFHLFNPRSEKKGGKKTNGVAAEIIQIIQRYFSTVPSMHFAVQFYLWRLPLVHVQKANIRGVTMDWTECLWMEGLAAAAHTDRLFASLLQNSRVSTQNGA